jgi:hypothetical protein
MRRNNFFSWRSRVEKIVYDNLKVFLDDLPDENYRINFENGVSAQTMAEIVLSNNRFG